MQFEEIYPSIIVYKNPVEDIDSLLDKVKYTENKSHGDFIIEEWSQWFVFGTYTNVRSGLSGGEFEDIVRNSSGDEVAITEKEVIDTINTATQQCIDHYVSYKGLKLPDSSIRTQPNIAKYIRSEWLDDTRDSSWGGLAMQFHTDYEMGKWFLGSRQFLLTANLYFNDDYEGGEILFLHNRSIIKYKPQKGDLIVFPSGSPLYPDVPNRNPYFHGVGLVSGGEKYFTRSYIQYETENKDFYYELKNQFKDEEEFERELQRRFKLGVNTIGVFFGEGPSKGGAVPFDPRDWGEGKSFWVSGHEIIDFLYDMEYEKIFFRNDAGKHINE